MIQLPPEPRVDNPYLQLRFELRPVDSDNASARPGEIALDDFHEAFEAATKASHKRWRHDQHARDEFIYAYVLGRFRAK